MVTRCKVIISETEPQPEVVENEEGQQQSLGITGIQVGYLWFKPDAGTPKFYQATSVDPLVWEEIPVSGTAHNINFTGMVSVDGDEGITGSKTLGGYIITFKKGLLTGFAAV